MALPLKTTADDVRKIVSYLKTKPTGAPLDDARSALGKQLLDGRKLSAYRVWGITTADGGKYRLTDRGWELARYPEREAVTFRQILDAVVPYRSALDWMFHQGFDDVTAVDVAVHWHQHHTAHIGPDAKDATLRENAISFFHICQAGGLGRLVPGRSGKPTRFAIDRRALKDYVEAGPSTLPSDELTGVSAANDGVAGGAAPSEDEGGVQQEAYRSDTPTAATQPLRVFIAHGRNLDIVEQVETMLGLADIEAEIAEEEESTAIPVPEKVFSAMRRCTAGIIVVNPEQVSEDETARINENVLIEIGAAFVLYDRRVVLLWDKRLPVPSNLQGLYRCEYEGEELSWSAGMKLMKAIQQFKG